jgi:hypothetical protein
MKSRLLSVGYLAVRVCAVPPAVKRAPKGVDAAVAALSGHAGLDAELPTASGAPRT